MRVEQLIKLLKKVDKNKLVRVLANNHGTEVALQPTLAVRVAEHDGDEVVLIQLEEELDLMDD